MHICLKSTVKAFMQQKSKILQEEKIKFCNIGFGRFQLTIYKVHGALEQYL